MADNPDMALAVEFFVKPVEHPAKTREAGRPIYDEREMIRIRFPADSKRELVAPAHEMHFVSHARTQMTYAERFAASYAAFKSDEADFVSGTPLIAASFLSAGRRAELEAIGVKTVEQLAGLPKAAQKRLGMGAMELIEQATDYLSTADQRAEIDALKAQIAAMQAAQAVPQDEFAELSDDDLKNMIRDAGGDVPRGVAGRAKLVDRLREIADSKTEAA